MLSFSVEPGDEGETSSSVKTPDPEWEKYLEDAVICESLDDDKKPVNPKTIFGAEDIFYCSVTVKDLPADLDVSTKWYFGSKLIADANVPLPDGWTGYIGFHCKPTTTWPAGNYSVEIYFNDNLAAVRELQVE